MCVLSAERLSFFASVFIIAHRTKRLHNLLSNEFKLFFFASVAAAVASDGAGYVVVDFFCACLNCVHAHFQVLCLPYTYTYIRMDYRCSN